MSAKHTFRDWPIAVKLNAVQSLTLIVLFVLAIGTLTLWLERVLEAKSLVNIKQANQQVLDMLSAYNVAMEKNAEKLGNVLVARFPEGFRIEDGASVELAGVSTPLLKSGAQTLNRHFETVDAFTAHTEAVATIFARQGDDFVRVATSLKKENGERAIGTLLGSAHPAHARLLRGEVFTGKAKLFGKDYMTRYLPQRDKSGQVVAVLFIGLEFTQELAALKERVRSLKFLKSGYVFALDAGKDKGTLTIHPAQEGKNLLEAKDANGVAFIADMLNQKSGMIDYQFMNPSLGETRARDKVAVFDHFGPWDWVIASSCYRDELAEEAAALRNRLIGGALLLVVVLLLTVFFSTRRWISTPLNEAVQAMQSIAGGNLVVRMHEHGHDEVGQLLDATQAMAKSMIAAISDIQNASRQLVDCADHLADSAGRVLTQSGVQNDAAATMASCVEEMNASISHVADNAHAAKNTSSQSGSASRAGATVIRETVDNMVRISETVRNASATVAQLGEESQHISAIVNVIKEIADQTNLLALNAAIEAARAGEQGRGFAVVADEVRKLAERTSLSTREIEEMIVRIQSGTTDAVSSMEAGVRQVEAGVEYAGKAGESIDNIRQSAEQVAAAVSDISAALAEQSVASGDIAANVERIAGMANENHAVAQQSANYADELKGLADGLKARVSHFRIS